MNNELSKYGFETVEYDGLIKVIRDAISNDAHEYAIAFVNDIAPYELFHDNTDSINSLLMRFIAKVGIGAGPLSIELEVRRLEEFEKKISSKTLYWEAAPV